MKDLKKPHFHLTTNVNFLLTSISQLPTIEFAMKDCPEIEEILKKVIGDDVVGFFERRLTTSVQEVRVFTLVRTSANTASLAKSYLN